MRYYKILFLSILISALALFAADVKKSKMKGLTFSFLNDIDVSIEDANIVMSSLDEPYDTIVFTEENDLYINGEKVSLNRSQQKLVSQYRKEIYEILDMAAEVGIAGAGVGVAGTRVGVKAIVNLVKLLDDDYDTKDLEEELKIESEKLEEYAEELKEKAEELEEMEENLEETHDELREELRELQNLGWF